MKPFETLGEFTTPEGHRLTLHRRTRDYYLYFDGEELMSTRRPASESALATLACRYLPDTKRPRVLIGGLGFGFTLRAALDALPQAAEVVVAEVFPAVVDWNRDYLAEIQGHPLDDRRVRVCVSDVQDLLQEKFRGRYQAILLDVDNTPEAWCIKTNSQLYDKRGLDRIKQCLSPGGILAVWSANPEPAFIKRLRKIGFKVSTETVRAFGGRGSRHTIFLALK
jgi:spermidine synthase